ncbi:DUF6454 family protein [Rathayibacter soli]|uniref:DUF6454 family protein n=1 Tax=Rathayibacter soli TaxID=3144168 RepID=UPI0027E3B779|nr:DUF6454 family protein [Glaciibacter superstes]
MTGARSVFQAGRDTRWELVGRIPLRFATHHPQGLAFAGDRIILSSVEVTEEPQRLPNPPWRTAGRGIGHVFVLDDEGSLLRDILLADGHNYHPGGIAFDGAEVWVPVAEYRPASNAIVFTIDPATLEVTERFRVRDHVGWIVSDAENGVLHGANWGSREFTTWTQNGTELDRWSNPSGFVDYQDAQYAGGGRVLCSGIAVLPTQHGSDPCELGGIAIVDFPAHRVQQEMPVAAFSDAGHVVTRNPFALTEDSGDILMHVAPDDGTDAQGTALLTYRAAT